METQRPSQKRWTSRVLSVPEVTAILARAFTVKTATQIYPYASASDNTLQAHHISKKTYRRIHRVLLKEYPNSQIKLEYVQKSSRPVEKRGILYATNRYPLQTELGRLLSADVKAQIDEKFLPPLWRPHFGQFTWDSTCSCFDIKRRGIKDFIHREPDGGIRFLKHDSASVPEIVIDVSTGGSMEDAGRRAERYLAESIGMVHMAIAVHVKRGENRGPRPAFTKGKYIPCLDISEDTIRHGDVIRVSVVKYEEDDMFSNLPNGKCYCVKNVQVFPRVADDEQVSFKLRWGDIVTEDWTDMLQETAEGQDRDFWGPDTPGCIIDFERLSEYALEMASSEEARDQADAYSVTDLEFGL